MSGLPWTRQVLLPDALEEWDPEDQVAEEREEARLMTGRVRTGDNWESDADDPWAGCYR